MATQTRSVVRPRRSQYRYGVVFVIVFTLLVFEIAAPAADWARALSAALAGAALTVALATSGAPSTVRRQRALGVSAATIVIVIGTITGLFSATVVFAVLAVIIAAIPFTLVGGLLRLVSEEGVTTQAVAGGLVIYLVVGLLFAAAVAFVSHVQSGPYFTQGNNVSDGARVYYSFTVLTTTGFGDYTAAKPGGRALAVVEMLTGQLYLVTVIGVLVGHFVRRWR